MHTITLNIQDNVYDKIYYFLSNLPRSEVQIIEEKSSDNWSHMEVEIDKGLNSGICNQSHEKIISNIKNKYTSS